MINCILNAIMWCVARTFVWLYCLYVLYTLFMFPLCSRSSQVMVSDEEQDAISTDPDELLDSDDSEGISGDEEDIFRNLLARAGFHLSYGDNPPLLLDPSQLQVTLREKLLMDAGAIAAFLTGLRVYLDDPAKVKRLLLPTKLSSPASNGTKKGTAKGEATSPSLMNLLMGVKVLQQAIADLLLDIMVECCQPSNGDEFTEAKSRLQPDASQLGAKGSFVWRAFGAAAPDTIAQSPAIGHRLDNDHDGMMATQAVQSCIAPALDVQASKGLVLPSGFLSESVPRDTASANASHSQKVRAW